MWKEFSRIAQKYWRKNFPTDELHPAKASALRGEPIKFDCRMNTEKTPVMVVVGGAGGIGSAVARKLAARGCKLIIAGRNAARLETVAAETGAQVFPLDARDGAAVDAMMQSVQTSHGRVDDVVNCAGSILLKPAYLISDREFADTIATNLTTAFNLVRATTRLMMKQAGSVGAISAQSQFALAEHPHAPDGGERRQNFYARRLVAAVPQRRRAVGL
jgi:NAD(P)-dependent dehydrogenase (short-subunit alcohol dehydrogenase family)